MDKESRVRFASDPDGPTEIDLAMRRIIQGALQRVASMLLAQIPQAGIGENDMHSGIRLLEEAQAKRRAYRRNHPVTLEAALAMANGPGPKRGGRHKK